ncbi:MAG: glycosyltransferase [Methanomicrobiales archaeon]|nr:glycosyltransferase [Methanomicrobiales archaeon]
MVSVIIPAYNEEAVIGRCLSSLNDQTLPREEYEIIVVDGNSKDRTREIAAPLADRVLIQKSPRVGGARNDGVLAAEGEIIATTDADCICPRNWLERIRENFERESIVQLYGPVFPIEDGLSHRLSLGFINICSALAYRTGALFYSLGCNSAFDREAFIRAGMYRCIDAGDDLEIALRMKKIGRILRDPKLSVGFSMRRYEQFGTWKSLYEWAYIVAKGGNSDKHSYSRREYR